VSSDSIHIRPGSDLDAFLRLTKAKPTKLPTILYKLGSTYYINLSRSGDLRYYPDELEDSEEEIAKWTGGKTSASQKITYLRSGENISNDINGAY